MCRETTLRSSLHFENLEERVVLSANWPCSEIVDSSAYAADYESDKTSVAIVAQASQQTQDTFLENTLFVGSIQPVDHELNEALSDSPVFWGPKIDFELPGIQPDPVPLRPVSPIATGDPSPQPSISEFDLPERIDGNGLQKLKLSAKDREWCDTPGGRPMRFPGSIQPIDNELNEDPSDPPVFRGPEIDLELPGIQLDPVPLRPVPPVVTGDTSPPPSTSEFDLPEWIDVDGLRDLDLLDKDRDWCDTPGGGPIPIPFDFHND